MDPSHASTSDYSLGSQPVIAPITQPPLDWVDIITLLELILL